MRWKITGQILGLLLVILPVFYGSLFVFSILLFGMWSNPLQSPQPSESFSSLTIGFEQYLTYRDGQLGLTAEGAQVLQDRRAWLQVLDESGKEVFEVGKPASAPRDYTPADLILSYRYSGAIKDGNQGYTLFVAMADRGVRRFSYILGFPDRQIVRAVVTANPFTIYLDIFKVLGGALLVVTLVTTLLALFYGAYQSAPLANIIAGIQRLARQDDPAIPSASAALAPYPETGLYASVFGSLNRLSLSLQENQMERQRLEKAREEWIANISHDIKTPLSSLKGFAELLADPDYRFDEDEVRRYAQIMQDKAVSMETLLSDLRLAYQLRQAALPLDRQPLNLVALVQEAVIDLLNDPAFSDAPLSFEGGQEDLSFTGDARLLQRAFTNLVANALVHNPSGTPVAVTISTRITGAGKEEIQVAIQDQGQGIPPDQVERLFERYYQGTNTGSSHKGSGLGLAIARQIIEAHGGQVRVDSRSGEGTRVDVTLSKQ